eukprot:8809031-Pyramimonas_sp.AAC.1
MAQERPPRPQFHQCSSRRAGRGKTAQEHPARPQQCASNRAAQRLQVWASSSKRLALPCVERPEL